MTTFEVGNIYKSKDNENSTIKVTRRTKCYIEFTTYFNGEEDFIGSQGRQKVKVIEGREYIFTGIYQYYPDAA